MWHWNKYDNYKYNHCGNANKSNRPNSGLHLTGVPTAYSSGSVGENSKYKYEKYKYSQRVAQAVFALCVEQKKHRKYKY